MHAQMRLPKLHDDDAYIIVHFYLTHDKHLLSFDVCKQFMRIPTSFGFAMAWPISPC
jgi:hypothetical protein